MNTGKQYVIPFRRQGLSYKGFLEQYDTPRIDMETHSKDF